MKKILTAVLTMFVSMSNVWAQEDSEPAPLEQMIVYENPSIYVTLGDIVYEPKTAVDQVKSTVLSAITSSEVSLEMESMVPMVVEALQVGVRNPFRIRLLEGEPTEAQIEKGAYVFSATITGCNSTNALRDDKILDRRINVTAFVRLTNVKTGEIAASAQIGGWSWSSYYTTETEAEKAAVHNLKWDLINRINGWFPLRGHMLDKGFEKGRKQKLKEIYIDLGTDQGLAANYDVNVYTVRRIAGRIARKYIGRGKVQEVMGNDISLVKLSRGADLIKQAFDNGVEIAISVQ